MSVTARCRTIALAATLLALAACGAEPESATALSTGPATELESPLKDFVAIPADWTCEDRFYGEGWCDCGCGVVDIDCPDADLFSCIYNACEGPHRPVRLETTACEYNFASCHPEHEWATDMPRRHPLDDEPEREKS